MPTTEFKELSAQLQKLAADVTTLKEENKMLRNDDPDKKTTKQAKENVPTLKDQDSYIDFIYFMNKYLNLIPEMKKFVQKIKVPDTTKGTSREKLYTLNKDALTVASKIKNSELHNFNTWIVSKIHKDVENVYKTVNEDAPVEKQILELWYNIEKRFNRNSDAAREAHQIRWQNFKQPTEGMNFEEFKDAALEKAKMINKLWANVKESPYSATIPKIHDSEIWTKIKHNVNAVYKDKLADTFRHIDSQKDWSLYDKLSEVENKLLDTDQLETVTDNVEFGAESSMMARTNVPKRTTQQSEYSKVTMPQSYLDNMVCKNFNGVPDSCYYGSTCKFRHINNAQERKIALKKQDEFFKNRDRSWRANRSDGEEESKSDLAKLAQLKRKYNNRKGKHEKVRAMIAYLEDIIDDPEEEQSDSFEEHDIMYTEGTDEFGHEGEEGQCVVSSLAVTDSEDVDADDSVSEDSSSDSDTYADVYSISSLYEKDIKKEMQKLQDLKKKNDRDVVIKESLKDAREQKKLKDSIIKARQQRERLKKDHDKWVELKQNVLKEELKAEKIKKERQQKIEEQKRKQEEEKEKQKIELQKIIEETRKYKEYMEQDLSSQSESGSEDPIKSERSRGSCTKKCAKSVFSNSLKLIKFLFLLFTGFTLISVVVNAPSYLGQLVSPTIVPSTAEKFYDVGHSFLVNGTTQKKDRRLGSNLFGSTAHTVLDSGTTEHLSGDKSKFVGKLHKLSIPRKILGFSATGTFALYSGTIQVDAFSNGKNKKILLKNVLYVPCMKNLTLVSHGRLDEEGHKIVTVGGKGRCSFNGKTYFDFRKINGLYHLEKSQVSFLAMSKNAAHRKFGHINECDLNKLGDWSGELSP